MVFHGGTQAGGEEAWIPGGNPVKQLLIIYLRLSKEDALSQDESNSITNQRRQIVSYIRQNGFQRDYTVKEFADDGYSGKNLDRPGMADMMRLIRRGLVGMIVVKDFSRLARDHIVTGDLIDKILPLAGVRLIAIDNHYDSGACPCRFPDISVPFQNLIYDYYSEETSEKVKKQFERKRERGDFFGHIPPYGYLRDLENPARLLRDRQPAALVSWMFDRCARDHMTKAKIAGRLNETLTPTPSAYLASLGHSFHRVAARWTAGIVGRILHDPVHIGIVVSEKFLVTETGSSKKNRQPRNRWAVCWGMHEPNVSLDQFLEVQVRDRTDFWYIFENPKKSGIPDYALAKIEGLRAVRDKNACRRAAGIHSGPKEEMSAMTLQRPEVGEKEAAAREHLRLQIRRERIQEYERYKEEPLSFL